MAVLRRTLVLCVLTALLTDAVPLLFLDIPDNGGATVRADPFTDTIAAIVNDVRLRIGAGVRAGAPQSGEPYVVKPVLEPGTMFLMGSGLLGISVWARRRWARRR